MSYDLGTAHGKIVLDYEGAHDVDRAEKDIEKLRRKAVDGDKSVGRLGKTLKGLGKGVAIAGIAVGLANGATQAASLAIQLAGMVPQLVSISSLSAAIPGLFAAGAASVGVMKAALVGVGDAVKEAFNTESADKFNKALEKLSPAAQDFARKLRETAPALIGIQQGIQEAFFNNGFEALLPRLTAGLKSIQPTLNGLASDFGRVGKSVASFVLDSDQSWEFLESAMLRVRAALTKITPTITPVLEGLRSVGVVGLPLIDRLGDAVANTANKFAGWLNAIASDGRLEDWINTALSTLNTLGGIAKNVGSILSSVFKAAGETGGGLLNTIETITGQFADFLNSAEGSAAIRALFTGIGAAAKALSPIFTTLAGALAGALGPALAQLATGIGPALLQIVEALAPAFGPLAMAIAQVATAIAPILPPVAQLIALLARMASGVLSSLASSLGPVIELLGGAFSSALTQLTPVIDQIVAQLPQFAAVGLQLAQALLPLVPAIIQFASALTTALLPYLPQLMTAFMQLVPPLVQIATIMGQQLASALIAIIPYLPQIIGFLVGLQVTIFTVVNASLQFIAVLLKLVTSISSLPGRISGAIEAFKSAVSNGFNAVIAAAKQFPYRVGQAIGILLTILVNGARTAWNALKAAFNTGVSTAVNLARTLPGRVRSAVANLPGLLASLASQAWNRLKSAFSGGVSNATNVAHTLPGRIKSALGNMGSLLVSAGRDVVMGLVRGISGAVGAAVSAAVNVGKSVINGIRSTLKISSPSRVMIEIGRFVTQGLVKGLLGSAKQVQAASNRLANMVTDAFAAKAITKNQKNSVLNTLNSGTKQMLALVNKANTIAAKLKVAQKNLNDVRKKYAETFNSAVQKTKESFSLIGTGEAAADVGDAKERFAAAVKQAQDFAVDIEKLRKRGLGKDLIGQLLNAGPEAAGAMADALANADDKTIREFVQLQNNLNRAANAVGNTAVDTMYGAGLKAAQGLVDGLKSQQKAIEAQMLKIAKSIEYAIKKALKIKSPSRVMFELGRFTGEGLKLGIEALLRQVEQAAQKLATASVLPTVQLTTAQSPAALARATVSTTQDRSNHAEARNFGPYQLVLDGAVVTSFVVDTITGNPKVVSKSASEGDRQNSWAGSGRGNG